MKGPTEHQAARLTRGWVWACVRLSLCHSGGVELINRVNVFPELCRKPEWCF